MHVLVRVADDLGGVGLRYELSLRICDGVSALWQRINETLERARAEFIALGAGEPMGDCASNSGLDGLSDPAILRCVRAVHRVVPAPPHRSATDGKEANMTLYRSGVCVASSVRGGIVIAR
jgi:hypothetical protein